MALIKFNLTGLSVKLQKRSVLHTVSEPEWFFIHDGNKDKDSPLQTDIKIEGAFAIPHSDQIAEYEACYHITDVFPDAEMYRRIDFAVTGMILPDLIGTLSHHVYGVECKITVSN